MKILLVISTVLWSAFVCAYYYSRYCRYIRFKEYGTYADTTFKAVQQHFNELNTKSQTLVTDLGFNKKDESAWEAEVRKFVSMIIFEGLPAHAKEKIRLSPSRGREFSTLAYNMTKDLMCYAKLPSTYNLKEVIDSIENTDSLRSIYNPSPMITHGREVWPKIFAITLMIGALAEAPKSNAESGAPFPPFEACNALADENDFMPSRSGYSVLSGNTYSCGTLYKYTSKSDAANNLSMYAKGTKTDVTRVKLMLNINNKQTASRDTKELGRLCEKMVKNLLGSTPAGLGTKIAAGVPFEMVYESYNLFLKKDVWPTGKGYELNCFITTLDHKE